MQLIITRISMIGNELSFANLIQHQSEHLFDKCIFTFHNSYDGTKESLEVLPNAEFRVKNERGYPQSTISTQMLREAFSSGADVCIPLDADEFIPFESQKNLKDFLKKYAENFDYVAIPWRNCAPKPFPINSNFSNLEYAHEFSNIKKVIVFKSAMRKDPDLELSQGNHLILSKKKLKWKLLDDFYLVHIPFRSQLQYAQKMLQGASILFEENEHDLSDQWIDGVKKPFISSEELFEICMDYGEEYCSNHPSFSRLSTEFIRSARYFELDEVKTFNIVMSTHWNGVAAMLRSVKDSDKTALEFFQLQRRLEKAKNSRVRSLFQKFLKLIARH